MGWMVRPSVVWISSRDEIQLYDTTGGEFQTLNATGAAIWRQLVKNGDQDAIVTGLAEEFGAEDDTQRALIADDALRFIEQLAAQGLIQAEPTASDRPATPG